MTWAEIVPDLERGIAETFGEEMADMGAFSIAPNASHALPLFDLGALDGEHPPARQWIVPGFIPAGEIALLTGAGGAGKSLLSQQLATCLAAGAPFLGMALERRPTLYVTAEDDETELHRRQRNINCAVSPGDLSGHLHLSSLRGREANELATFDRDGALEATDTFAALRATIAQTGARVLILDNIAHLFSGNENDRGQVTRFVNLLYSLVQRQGVSIILIGHPNKSGDAYLGSTAWLNAVRAQVEIARPDDGEDGQADADARVLRVGKANYARHGTETRFRWLDHAFVAEDELPAETRADLADTQRVVRENEVFLACLRARGAGREVGPNVGPNYAPARFAEMTEAKGLTKQALTRAMERLFHIGAIEVREVKREGKGGTKTIIAEASRTTPERGPEPLPNTFPNGPELPHRTAPNIHPSPKGEERAGPHDGPPPDPDQPTDLVPMPPSARGGKSRGGEYRVRAVRPGDAK